MSCPRPTGQLRDHESNPSPTQIWLINVLREGNSSYLPDPRWSGAEKYRWIEHQLVGRWHFLSFSLRLVTLMPQPGGTLGSPASCGQASIPGQYAFTHTHAPCSVRYKKSSNPNTAEARCFCLRLWYRPMPERWVKQNAVRPRTSSNLTFSSFMATWQTTSEQRYRFILEWSDNGALYGIKPDLTSKNAYFWEYTTTM